MLADGDVMRGEIQTHGAAFLARNVTAEPYSSLLVRAWPGQAQCGLRISILFMASAAASSPYVTANRLVNASAVRLYSWVPVVSTTLAARVQPTCAARSRFVPASMAASVVETTG